MYQIWMSDKIDVAISGNGDGTMRARAYCFEGDEIYVPKGERLVFEASSGKQIILRREPITKEVSLAERRKELLSILINAEPDEDVVKLGERIIKLFQGG